MNEMVRRHVGFGSDLFFTYGPYASAYTWQYGPETDRMMLFATGLSSTSLAIGYLALAPRHKMWILLLAPMLASINGIRDARFLIIPFLLVTLLYRFALPSNHHSALPITKARLLAAFYLVVACAILPLIKISFSTVVFGLAVPATILAFRVNVRAAIAGIALFVASLLIFWLVGGQHINGLWGYWHSQIPLVSGFSDAMSLSGPVAEIVAFVACAVALGWLAIVDSQKDLTTIPQTLWLLSAAFLLFMAFKAGFMRQDHVFIALITLQLVGIVFFLQSKLSTGVPALIVSLGCCLAVATTSKGDTIEGQLRQVRTGLAHAHLGIVLRLQRGTIDALYQQAVDKIIAESPITPREGTNDIYPANQSLLLAPKAGWAPRPGLQGYETYAPSIQILDADFLATDRAAKTIFYSIGAIDLQYPSLQDGASWPNLLTRYHFTGFQGEYAVLTRNQAYPPPSFGQAQTSTRGLGEVVSLSSRSTAIWAKIRLKKTALGKLASLLFKAPELSINVQLADGRSERFKYVEGMGEEGFVLSPLVTTTRQFVALTSKYKYLNEKNRVTSFSITTSSYWDWIWASTYTLSVTDLSVQPNATADDLLVGQIKPLDIDLSGAGAAECHFDSIDDKPFNGASVQSDGLLSLNGWSAIDASKGIGADDAYLLINGVKGKFISRINRVERPDVAKAYMHPELKVTGYQELFDLQALAGAANISILQMLRGKPYVCPQSFNVEIKP